MGFTFSSHSVEVEIEGEQYVIDLGDAEMLDKVEDWGRKLQAVDYNSLSENRTQLLSSDVQGYLTALLGKEQFSKAFKNRRFNFIDGLELFAYLWSEVARARVAEDFRGRLAKYMPEIDWESVGE